MTLHHQFEIRAALNADLKPILELARFLDSVNLPNDEQALREILALSEDSFTSKLSNPLQREFLFVLCERKTGRVVGTSQILAQLGRRESPYIYFDVRTEEKYSTTLDGHFRHPVLSIRYSFDGPTEIGGLVVHPDYRGRTERLGAAIAYIRFMWIAMHRPAFRDQVIAELLPPLEADGTSHLWEAIGRHFTGLTYREADRLSKRNKEFIRELFPRDDIYASMLSPEAQRVIGEVGENSKGVARLLSRVGFEYVHRVDPFDGGPHFGAQTSKIACVEKSKLFPVEVVEGLQHGDYSVGVSRAMKPYFLALPSAGVVCNNTLQLDKEACEILGVREGEEVWAMPNF